jgi:hypothetical protein
MAQDKTRTDRPVKTGAAALDRRKRQAEALRRNLLLRKAQARRRDGRPDDGTPPDEAC